MSDPLIEIADALVAALNDHTFSQSFTAERTALPEFTREQLAELQVRVVPIGFDEQLVGRDGVEEHYQVDVAMWKGIPEGDSIDDAVGAYGAVLREIRAYVREIDLEDYGCEEACWIGTESLPGSTNAYFPDQLRAKREFCGVLRLTYLWTGN